MGAYLSSLFRKDVEMKDRELRRSMALFPIGSLMKLTGFTARQIRYYEEQDLIHPQRTKSNHRLYSLNDMDRLLEIREMMDEGRSLTSIKDFYKNHLKTPAKELSQTEVRRALRDDLMKQSPFSASTSIFGR